MKTFCRLAQHPLTNLEQFSIECRKITTKAISLANRNRSEESELGIEANQNSKQIHVTGDERGKTRERKS